MDIQDIKRSHIQRMIDKCPTYKTAKNARDTLSCVLSLAVEDELLPRNPASNNYRYPPEKVGKTSKDGAWLSSYTEHKKFLDRIHELKSGHQLEYISILGLCFGLRPGEIFGLDWATVDFKNREISIVQTLTDGARKLNPPKTPKGYRTIPMTSFAFDKLTELYKSYENSERPVSVIARKDGRRYSPSTARDQMDIYTNAHKDVPDVTIASLRHSFASAAIRSGADINDISKMMGHSDIYVTMNRYVKPRTQDIKNAMAMIDEAFSTA